MNNRDANYQNYFMNQNNIPNPVGNMNFNKCMYTPQEQPSDLYDAYEGFIRGNMFPDLYNQYKVSQPINIEPMNEEAQALTYVNALSFGAHDLNLYLDNFPNDQSMIELYNQYRMEANRAREQYEKQFGPLLVNSDATNTVPWSWNNTPWPWDN